MEGSLNCVMDIKEKINEIVKKLQSDPTLMEQFRADPVKALEGLTGLDLPDDMLKQAAEGVKAKLAVDSLAGAADKLKGLFGK